MKPRLIAINGPAEGTTFPLDVEEVSIGRGSTNSVCLNHRSVSRQHCLIKREGDEFKLRDLESYNGTFINGLPVKEQALSNADQIRIGNIALLFMLDESGPLPQAALVEFDDSNLLTQSTKRAQPEVLMLQTEQFILDSAEHQRVTRDLAAILKISTRINLLRGTEELKREILDSIFEIIPAERGAVVMRQAQTDEDTLYGRDRFDENQPVRVSRTIINEVISEGVAILSNDIQGSDELNTAESLVTTNTTSVMCAPLIIFSKVIGAIYLDSRDPTIRFDDRHLQLLAGISGIAAVALENARQMEWLQNENQRLRSSLAIEHNMIGEGRAMQEVYRFIERVAPTNSAVLLCGESGTGKELAAHAIHANSPRAAKPFVVINCAALTETLLESELFGHEKGAFTGAIALKKGKLEIAHGGTVFLDEIGEMPASLQARLLRFLQDHKVERVGSTRSIDLDVRVIAATNRNLEEEIKKGAFRADLYHRLNVVTVTMPPLRQRREDIPLLANYFAAKYANACKRPVSGFTPQARRLLQNYDWPGNVRELQNAIERAVVMGSTEAIEVEDLPDRLCEVATGPDLPTTNFYQAMKQAKRELIIDTLSRTSGNYTEAAKLLGIHPNNLHRLIRTLDLRGDVSTRV